MSLRERIGVEQLDDERLTTSSATWSCACRR
jgi:hypothetical protein